MRTQNGTSFSLSLTLYRSTSLQTDTVDGTLALPPRVTFTDAYKYGISVGNYNRYSVVCSMKDYVGK